MEKIQPLTREELEAQDWEFTSQNVPDPIVSRSLFDIKAGDNLRGAVVTFDTSLLIDIAALEWDIYEINAKIGNDYYSILSLSRYPGFLYNDGKNNGVLYNTTNSWVISSLTFRDDVDIIVQSTNVTTYDNPAGMWGFKDSEVTLVDPLEWRIRKLEADAVQYDENNNIVLRQPDSKILSSRQTHLVSERSYPLATDPTKSVFYSEFGNTESHFNGNTDVDPEYDTHGTMDTPDGKKEFAYKTDLNSVEVRTSALEADLASIETRTSALEADVQETNQHVDLVEQMSTQALQESGEALSNSQNALSVASAAQNTAESATTLANQALILAERHYVEGDLSEGGVGVRLTLDNVAFLIQRANTTEISIRATATVDTIVNVTVAPIGQHSVDSAYRETVIATAAGALLPNILVGDVLVIGDVRINNIHYAITAGSTTDDLSNAWVRLDGTYQKQS